MCTISQVRCANFHVQPCCSYYRSASRTAEKGRHLDAEALTACHCAGKLMCRFLFRRCDNETAPWSSSTAGDGPWQDDLPDEATDEMNNTEEPVERPTGQAFWDYDHSKECWRWFRSPPVSAAKPRAAPSLKKEEGAVRFSTAHMWWADQC